VRSLEEILIQADAVESVYPLNGVRLYVTMTVPEHALVWRASRYRHNEPILFLGDVHIIDCINYLDKPDKFVIELRQVTLCDL